MPSAIDAPRRPLRRVRTVVWSALLLIAALVLAFFVPLFDALGFEFAFVMGILAALAAVDQGARLAREGERPLRALLLTVVVVWLELVPPLIVISLNALRVRQCDWSFGLLCYLLLPMSAAVFGSVWGVIAGTLLRPRPRLAMLLAWLIPIGSFIWGVSRFISTPAIFGYDPFVGYFPGALYDENLSFAAAFYWARLGQLLWAGAALAGLLAWQRRRRAALVVAGTLLVGAAVYQSQLGRLGVAPTAGDVAQALGGTLETEHFVIHYPKSASFAALMPAIASEHEFRLAQVVERLGGVWPRQKIHSFYFASAADKQRWMGARHTYIAKPWRYEIYIQHDSFPHRTLRHEIAHVVAGEAGDRLFHVSLSLSASWPFLRFNVGLIEGIAVAADWPATDGMSLTPHQSAHAMAELGLLPPLGRLLGTSFFGFSAAQSYTTAGSFMYFLLQRYGAERLRQAFHAGGGEEAFAQVYGKDFAELEREWREEIAKAPLEPRDLEIARERYRKRAIFSRPCPHAIAARLEEAAEQQAEGHDQLAVLTIQRVCKDDPGEPNHLMQLATAQDRAGDRPAALATLARIYEDDGKRVSAPMRANAMRAAANLLAGHGQLPGAIALVDRALGLEIDDATRRDLLVRKQAFSNDDPASRALRDYLVPGSVPASGEKPDDALTRAAGLPALAGALGHYLYGRRLVDAERWAQAQTELEAARQAGLDEPLVRRENDRLLMKAAFLAGDLAACRAAATRLDTDEQPLQVRLDARDWLERVAFAEKHRAPAP